MWVSVLVLGCGGTTAPAGDDGDDESTEESSSTEESEDTGACVPEDNLAEVDTSCSAFGVRAVPSHLIPAEACPPSFLFVDAADFDGDGSDDLVLADWGHIELRLSGNGAEAVEVPLPAGVEPEFVVPLRFADLDGDGFLDLVSQPPLSLYQLGVFELPALFVAWGDGTGGRSEWQAFEFPQTQMMATPYRLSQETGPDSLLVSGLAAADGRLQVWNLQDRILSTEAVAPSAVRPLGTGDVDGDGRSDLLTLEPGLSGGIGIYLGQPGGSFDEVLISGAVLTGVHSSQMGDLDGDGADELVLIETPDNVSNPFPALRMWNFVDDFMVEDQPLVIAKINNMQVLDVNGDATDEVFLELSEADETGQASRAWIQVLAWDDQFTSWYGGDLFLGHPAVRAGGDAVMGAPSGVRIDFEPCN